MPSFNLTVYVDESIQTSKLRFYCNNGITEIYPASFKDNKSSIHGQLYSAYGTVTIVYYEDDTTMYHAQYWITSKPAYINLSQKKSKDLFEHSKMINGIHVFSENKMLLADLQKYSKKELSQMSNLHETRLEYAKNVFDSLEKQAFFSLMKKNADYIKKNNSHYFYFWFFIDQFYNPRFLRSGDTTSLVGFRDLLLNTFPKRYINSFTGKNILLEIESYLHPKINVEAPTLDVPDIMGNVINLNNYRGKIVLLDFWATWCLPCIKSTPALKEIRKRFSSDSLVIIGINCDRDTAAFTNYIRANELSWIHVFDKNQSLINFFGQFALPRWIIINQQGIIVYNETGEKKLEDFLEALSFLK